MDDFELPPPHQSVTPLQCGIILLLPIASACWHDLYLELKDKLNAWQRLRLQEPRVKTELACIFLAAIHHALSDHTGITKEQREEVYDVSFWHIVNRLNYAFEKRTNYEG